jgi:DNA-directed RNA polymerase specialized sigma24 family protein
VDRVADERTNVPEIAEVAAGTISFEEFFEEHHRRLFSALCAATANRHEAEEVMQEAFLKLWERWDRVSGLEDPVGYLYRTAMNVSVSVCVAPSSRCARRRGSPMRSTRTT